MRSARNWQRRPGSSQAAVRAGYSAKTAHAIGFKLLRKAEIAQAIEVKRKELAYQTGITRERILKEIAAIAFADVRKLFTSGGGMLDPTNIPDELASAIASIEIQSYTPPGEDSVPEWTKKVRLWDKPKALEQLMKHLGLDEDKPQPSASAVATPGMDVLLARLEALEL